MDNSSYYSFDSASYERTLAEVGGHIALLSDEERRDECLAMYGCIDNTTLNGTDSEATVARFCEAAAKPVVLPGGGEASVASVCVYPPFVALAQRSVAGSGLKVAAVAGAFPSGQLPIELKTNEVRYVVGEGADEVDYVINRGAFLGGDSGRVFDEVAAAREVCGASVALKVILETGELPTPASVYAASMVVMEAGADFIKTSTGKTAVGATPQAAYVMLQAIADFRKKNGKNVGLKVAGGISSVDDALTYFNLIKKSGEGKTIGKHNFRIGTSRLTSQIGKILAG